MINVSLDVNFSFLELSADVIIFSHMTKQFLGAFVYFTARVSFTI